MTLGPCISSDSHVLEPPELWTTRLPTGLRDRAPRLIRRDGADFWMMGELVMMPVKVGGNAGERFDRPGALTGVGTLDEVHRGGFDAGQRLADMDRDGIAIDVLYPTVAARTYLTVLDTALANAILSAYNDYIAEFCRAYPDRLKGIGCLNLDDIDWGIEELRRCRALGLVGAMIPAKPPADRPYSSPEYERFWVEAEALQVPLSLHIGSDRPGPGEAGIDFSKRLPPVRSARDFSVRVSLAHMLFGGVFERHPGLVVGSVEHESGWVPYFLEQIDYDYLYRVNVPGWPRFRDPATLPSDFFRRSVFVSFQQDTIGIQLRDRIGVDNLMWGSDYPHQESTFPRSREILAQLLAGCTDEEKARLTRGNAARVYSLQ